VNRTGSIPPKRAEILVLIAAVAAYGNSLSNGSAYDDNTVIRGNTVITEGRVRDALTSPYWPDIVDGIGALPAGHLCQLRDRVDALDGPRW
jgi:hypothetical protein